MKVRQAFSLVEVLIASLLLATAVVSLLSLSTQETRYSGAMQDRARALALASNMMTLVEHGSRDRLEAGAPDDDGSFVVDNAISFFPGSRLAVGLALEDWVKAKSVNVQFRWQPAKRGPASTTEDILGRLVCKVSWKLSQGVERSLFLERLLSP